MAHKPVAAQTATTMGYSVLVDNKKYNVTLEGNIATVNGKRYNMEIKEGLEAEHAVPSDASHAGSKDAKAIKAPLPGVILKVLVNVGDTVNVGDNLFIIESMKMETEIKAFVGGTVSAISVRSGDAVKTNQVLVWLN